MVLGGLEPFDDISNIVSLVASLRANKCMDDVVIYTGYTEDEVKELFPFWFDKLCCYGNIVIKFGRYIPGQKYHWDPVLCVSLSSSNQYAKRFGT